MVGMLASAFSDNEVTVDDQIAEGDKVVTRWSSKGTHSGEFFGIPATGKRVAGKGIGISRIVDGKIVEEWGESDMLGMMQQLGVIPPPEG
jgi:predicted ester cyclase